MEKLQALKQLTKTSRQGLFVAKELERLEALVRQAEMLAERYDAVVMNPPYMGRKYLNPVLRKFASSLYESGQADLYAMFIERNFAFCRKGHNVAMICMDSWLSGEDFQETRRSFVKQGAFVSMCHLGPHAFPEITGEVVQVASFVASVGCTSSYKCTFIDLVDEKNSFLKKQRLLSGDGRSIVATSAFADVPRGVFTAYRASPSVLAVFAESVPLKEIAEAFTGLQTGDNPRFIRYWFELPFHLVAFGHGAHDEVESSGKKWFPYVKGSDYRKWYGNQSCVVDWEEGGKKIRNHPSARPQNADKYFRTGIAYNNIAKRFSARHVDSGFVFDQKNSMFFAEAPEDLTLTLGLLNSDAVDPFLRILSPKDFGPGALKIMPVPKTHLKNRDIGDSVNRLIESHRHDWDSTEQSWGFQFLPLLSVGSGAKPTLESSYNNWISKNKKIINETKALEEENNRLFIAAYGLTDEFSPDVPTEQITLTVNPAYRYGGDGGEEEKWDRFQCDSMLEFLSYATGCMMGRYSLDQPGLVLADIRDSQSEQLAAFEQKVGKPLSEVQFKPDPDGIIPVLDGEWFEDDIVARTREFLAVTFPESSVAENLRFIEESIGKNIRKYFCTDFYKDHLQTYKRRPIYWMVQSPKKGFACLIYLHRYTKDTLNQVLNNYFRPYLQKLEARLGQLEQDQINDSLPTRERTAARKEAEKISKVLKECQAWEQDALLPLAQQRIELDLDDGVKVNYLKLKDVLAPIPGLAAKEY
jgi:hypothetical protein